MIFCHFRISDTTDFVKMLQSENSDLQSVDPIPTTSDFVDFLRRRALDDSVFVRKNALQVNAVSLFETFRKKCLPFCMFAKTFPI